MYRNIPKGKIECEYLRYIFPIHQISILFRDFKKAL